MIRKILPVSLSLIALSVIAKDKFEPVRIDLAGQWTVDLEDDARDGDIILPSTTDMAGFGHYVDNVGLNTTERLKKLARKYTYIGPAVYSRYVEITPEMAYKPLELSLERVLWNSEATIGGKKMGKAEFSLSTPHRHRLLTGLPAGRHKLEVKVDNRQFYDISPEGRAESYADNSQTIWNGILGDISLRSLPPLEIAHIDVYPSKKLDSITVKAYVYNNSGKVQKKKLEFYVNGIHKTSSNKIKLQRGSNLVTVSFPVSGLTPWSEFSPVLHEVTVSIKDGDSATEKFGMRSVGNQNGLTVNGTPVFLRGTVENCVFPLTGAPATDRKQWNEIFKKAKEWGLNHLRFNSWCPPAAAFEAADSLGFYLQVELPVSSQTIGKDPQTENFLKDEFRSIVSEYGNHPSFVLASVGNELQYDFDWLNSFVGEMKKQDPRRLYTTTSFTYEPGHGKNPEPEDQFQVTQWTDNGWIQSRGLFEKQQPSFDRNYEASIGRPDVPIISHAVGQYAVYPSVKEIDKYTGVLNPLNLKEIRYDLIERGMLDEAESMTQATARFAALLYKEEIERALKTSGLSGFQLLGLQDYPGLGTAHVGLVDSFGDNKGAVTEEWFRQFTAPVVPLIDYDKAVYTSTEPFKAIVSVANYSDSALPSGMLTWKINDEKSGSTIQSGLISHDEIASGGVSEVGSVNIPLSVVTQPTSAIVSVKSDNGIENTWRIFIYPERETYNDEIILTRDAVEAVKALSEGRKVLLSPSPEDIKGVKSTFLPVFWSPVESPEKAGTMGVMNDPDHPALAGFPNNGHSDWQWWTPVHNAKTMVLDSVAGVTPIVKVIDNFVNNRKLAYVFEANAGDGKLIFSSIDLLNPKVQTPEIKALRSSLIEYMKSDKFTPNEFMSLQDIASLSGKQMPAVNNTSKRRKK